MKYGPTWKALSAAIWMAAGSVFPAPVGAGPADGSETASAVNFTSSNLPILIIDTGGRAIPDAPKITADLGIIDNGPGAINRVTDPRNGYDGTIGIEQRGSSSAQFPKKPYGFETRDSLGANLNAPLLGMPAENDWVLYCPFSDKTLIRNVLSFELSNAMGRYASRTRFCEVVINGDYKGVYVLMEKIKRDKNRVAVAELDADDTAGDSLTGGYIVKIDKGTGDSAAGWRSAGGLYYQYHYPKPEDIRPEQKAYIRDFIDGFEAAVSGPGVETFIDMDSFVDNAIIAEVTRNVDAYRLSMFFHKDRNDRDGRLKAGPIWDCDLAFGNANYHMGESAEGWNLEALIASYEGSSVPFWWQPLTRNPLFRARFSERWTELRTGLLATDSLMDRIDALADTLAEAQDRNFRRWPVIGTYVWPNYFIGRSFGEEMEYLKEWLETRLVWIDGAVSGLAPVEASGRPGETPVDAALDPASPNPFNGSTVIRYNLRNASEVRLVVMDLLGRRVRTLAGGSVAAGRHAEVWDGRDDAGRPLPSGVYLCRLEAGASTFVRKLTMLQ
jgi:hypothetical protein